MVGKMEVEEILTDIENIIINSFRVPVTGKHLVDGDLLLDKLDKILAILPEELKQAKMVLDQSEKLLESVEMQGKRILEDAKNQAALLVSESGILRDAQIQAEAIAARALEATQEFKKESVAYAADVLQQLELNLEKTILALRKNKEDLRNYRY
ncbi:MAG: hypothetical protein FWD39_00320 [Clostridiales bacterium]|nr:hypothetical protein [Clostridiales bacterium]